MWDFWVEVYGCAIDQSHDEGVAVVFYGFWGCYVVWFEEF